MLSSQRLCFFREWDITLISIVMFADYIPLRLDGGLLPTDTLYISR